MDTIYFFPFKFLAFYYTSTSGAFPFTFLVQKEPFKRLWEILVDSRLKGRFMVHSTAPWKEHSKTEFGKRNSEKSSENRDFFPEQIWSCDRRYFRSLAKPILINLYKFFSILGGFSTPVTSFKVDLYHETWFAGVNMGSATCVHTFENKFFVSMQSTNFHFVLSVD